MAILGIDVGGTFTDAVLLAAGELHGEAPDRGSAGGVGRRGAARGRRRGGRALHARDDDRDERAPRAEGGARTRSSRPRASSTCSTCGAEPRAPLPALRRPSGPPSFRSSAAWACASGSAREGVVEALDSPRCRRSRRRRLRSACSSPFRTPPTRRRWRRRCGGGSRGAHVVASHEVSPEFREYERASTTAVDAYLGPVLSRYLGSLVGALRRGGLAEPLVMRSSGGVATAAEAAAHPRLGAVSGPAAGAVGAARVARADWDRGRDLARHGRHVDRRLPHRGRRGRARGAVSVVGCPCACRRSTSTRCGAGGGSLVWRDSGGALRVGPRERGRRAGAGLLRPRWRREPTVTDANLLLGGCRSGSRGGLELDRRGGAGRSRASIRPRSSRS